MRFSTTTLVALLVASVAARPVASPPAEELGSPFGDPPKSEKSSGIEDAVNDPFGDDNVVGSPFGDDNAVGVPSGSGGPSGVKNAGKEGFVSPLPPGVDRVSLPVYPKDSSTSAGDGPAMGQRSGQPIGISPGQQADSKTAPWDHYKELVPMVQPKKGSESQPQRPLGQNLKEKAKGIFRRPRRQASGEESGSQGGSQPSSRQASGSQGGSSSPGLKAKLSGLLPKGEPTRKGSRGSGQSQDEPRSFLDLD